MNTNAKYWLSLIVVILGMVISGCEKTTPMQAPVIPTTKPTNTAAVATLTNTPIPTKTQPPTITPTNTTVPTPTPVLPPGWIGYLSLEQDDRHTLGIMKADGSEKRYIQLQIEKDLHSILWSPNGQMVAYLSTVPHENMLIEGINIYNLSTGEISLLESPSITQFHSSRIWSPDGRYLVLIATTGVNSIVDIVDIIKGEVVATWNLFIYPSGIKFSPDSTKLAMVIDPGYPDSFSFSEDPLVITVIDIHTGQRNLLVEGDRKWGCI